MRILKEHQIDPKKIHIFVSDDEQKEIYENTIPRSDYFKIIVGVPGIKNIRNFMPKYFPEGQHIYYMDDDIYKLYDTINESGDIGDKSLDRQIPEVLKILLIKDLDYVKNVDILIGVFTQQIIHIS